MPSIEKREILNNLISAFESNMSDTHINAASIWSDTGWEIVNDNMNQFEISVLLEGSVSMEICGQVFNPRVGDMFFMDNNKPNKCANGDFTLFGMNFIINPKAHALYSTIKNLYAGLRGLSFGSDKEILRQYCTEIFKECNIKQERHDLNLKLLTLKMFIDILRQADPQYLNTKQYKYVKYKTMVSDIIIFLSENLNEDISLDEIAKRYHMTSRYVNLIFREVAGYPIIQYLQHLKMERAKKLLLSSDMSILEVALELSYGSSQYLNFMFKKMVGMTPGQYRKNSQTTIANK